MPQSITPSSRISLSHRQVAGYGIGEIGMNLYWGGAGFFLLYWYTDVAGLPNQTAGFLFFVGSFWDAITDPAMGIIAERTRTRWGRYRPYILLGSVPLAASFVMLLWVPPLEGIALVAALIAAHLLFRTAYTLVGVPYSALSARLTHDSQERTRLSGARMFFASIGGMLIAAAGFPLVSWLGEGSERDGFFMLAILAGLLAIAAHMICFLETDEPGTVTDLAGERVIRVRDVISMARLNRAFVLVFFMVLMGSAAGVLLGKSIIYYVKYALHEHESQYLVILVNGVFGLLMIPVWTFVSYRLGKKTAWTLATSIAFAAALVLFITPINSLNQFIGHLLSITLGTSALGVLFWSMLPDTVEYGEWKTGIRSEAIVFGFTTFAQKAAIGVAAWILSALMDVVGYQAGQEQQVSTLEGIKLIMTLVPAMLFGASMVLMRFYPITTALHNEIVREIDDRKKSAE